MRNRQRFVIHRVSENGLRVVGVDQIDAFVKLTAPDSVVSISSAQ